MMASRSTVRMPVAAACAAAWLASGESREESDFGSEAMFMPYVTWPAARVQPAEERLRNAVRQIIVFDEITEPRELPFELQSDSARRSVALLCDDDFGLAKGKLHVEL